MYKRVYTFVEQWTRADQILCAISIVNKQIKKMDKIINYLLIWN